MKRNLWMAVAFLASLTGCMAGVTSKLEKPMNEANLQKLANHKITVVGVTASVKDVPTQFLAHVKGELEIELVKRGLLDTGNSKNDNKVRVNITSYQMRGEAVAAAVGYMAGEDVVAGKVFVTDADGNKIATLDASTYNAMASSVPDYMVLKFAESVVETLEKNIAYWKPTKATANHQ